MAVADIYDAVITYDDDGIRALVEAEIGAGTDVSVILNDGIVGALDEIGRKFSQGTVFVPEMLMAAETAQAALDILKPLLAQSGAKPKGTIVIGTVKGDLHDIGKNLVGMMLEGAGFHLVDLGTDVDPGVFITAARDNHADIVALSGLLTTSMPEMEKAVVSLAQANNSRNLQVKVMVGGPPVNQEFADRIGANGYGVDATAAVALARTLVHP
ncbi:MAG: corrinoid protein [Rhodospirillales bacterium]|jgi:5-methyltetrahydrofolate--homocysteine methyltransferase|nr:corrinoid protein [Rhodospirillales bacterium]MDP6884257.1 corrinoid protein [Rhodospirillales bacterium]